MRFCDGENDVELPVLGKLHVILFEEKTTYKVSRPKTKADPFIRKMFILFFSSVATGSRDNVACTWEELQKLAVISP